jgi:hypothetical protein
MHPDGHGGGHPRHGKHHLFLTITVFFVAIMFFLIYTSFYDPDFGNSITGNVISEGNFEGKIDLEANLLVPAEFSISGNIGKVELRKKGDNVFLVGNKKFELKDSSIVLDDYEGNIMISNNIIKTLRGSAGKVFVEGIPISSDSKISVKFNDEITYGYLKLNDLNLNEFSLESSGNVKLNNGKAIVSLEDELFKVRGFSGNLEFKGSKLKIIGKIENSNLGFVNINN